MVKKEYSYLIDKANSEWYIKIHCRVNWNKGIQNFAVIEFARNKEEDQSHEIIKYDTEHGIFHVHKYYKKQKENINLEDKIKARKNQYKYAVEDIKKNGENYFEKYRKNKL